MAPTTISDNLFADSLINRGYNVEKVISYKRKKEIIEKEDLKDYIKGQNSIEYKPPMVDVFTGDIHTYRTPTRQEKAYLQSNTMSEFRPQVVTDIYSGSNSTGNNVELEREMMDLSKTGTKYTVLSNLERRQFSLLSDAIRGQ